MGKALRTGSTWWLALLLLCVFTACAGDLPEQKDSRPPVVDQQPSWDSPPITDAWVFPDLYSGSPFGCKSDADCFGKRCCLTPWNVRLCLDFCSGG